MRDKAARTLRRGAAFFGGDDLQLNDLALEGGLFEEVASQVGPLWIHAGNEVMRPYIREYGYWQQATTDLLGSLIRPGCRFLDVGADIGYFSLFGSQAVSGIQIDAVEPNPARFALLRANLWANGAEATTWKVALGAERKFVPLSTGSGTPVGSRSGTAQRSRAYDLVVPMVTADHLFPDRGFDVVRIDVSRWAPEVVAGMQRIVQNSPGIVLVVEFNPTALRARDLDPSQVVDRYRAMGFDLSVHDDWGLGNCAIEDVVAHCDSAGPNGHARLLLRRAK